MRIEELSIHVTFAPKAINCIALPPGAENKSKTAIFLILPTSFIGLEEEISCTHHLPSLNPLSSLSFLFFFILNEPVGSNFAPSFSFQYSTSSWLIIEISIEL